MARHIAGTIGWFASVCDAVFAAGDKSVRRIVDMTCACCLLQSLIQGRAVIVVVWRLHVSAQFAAPRELDKHGAASHLSVPHCGRPQKGHSTETARADKQSMLPAAGCAGGLIYTAA